MTNLKKEQSLKPIMRKLAFLLMFCALVMSAQAQKPSLNKAKSYQSKGELAEAVEMIELVVNDEKLGSKPDSWLTRMNIYFDVYNSGNTVGDVSPEQALELATASLAKVQEVEGKGEEGNYALQAGLARDMVYNQTLNKGVEFYNAGDLEPAITQFETLPLLKAEDTVGYAYAAQVANEIEDWPTVVENYTALGKMLKKPDYFLTVIQIQKDVMEDPEAAIETVALAKETLGDDNNDINKYEIDLLISLDKIEDAKNKLIRAIEAEPELAVLHLRLALLYDQLAGNERSKEDPDEAKLKEYESAAIDAYAATIERDPKNVTALYNFSVVYNEKANQVLKELDDMAGRSIKEYQKNQKAYNEKAMNYLKEGLPYMEQALEASPEDQDVLFALEVYYNRLKMTDKLEVVRKKMEELGYID